MRVRPRLNGQIRTPMPQVLDESGLLSQRPVVLDPYDGDAAASKIGHEHELTCLIRGDVAGACSTGRDGVQQPQLTRRVVNGKGAHVGGVVEWRSKRERIFRY